MAKVLWLLLCIAQPGGGAELPAGYRLAFDPRVSAELKLDDDQKAKLAILYDHACAVAEKELAASLPWAPAIQWKEKELALEREFEALLKPTQVARLREIQRKVMGAALLLEPELLKPVVLDAGQRARIEAAGAELHAAGEAVNMASRRALKGDVELDAAIERKRLASMKWRTDMGKVLRPDQRQALYGVAEFDAAKLARARNPMQVAHDRRESAVRRERLLKPLGDNSWHFLCTVHHPDQSRSCVPTLMGPVRL